MGAFEVEVVACPICEAALPITGYRLAHWLGHTVKIAIGRGAGGYTWTCSCGPSAMYWDHDFQAGAGLAIHMLDLHDIEV